MSEMDTWAIEECIDYGPLEAPAYEPPLGNVAREELRALTERAERCGELLNLIGQLIHMIDGRNAPSNPPSAEQMLFEVRERLRVALGLPRLEEQ